LLRASYRFGRPSAILAYQLLAALHALHQEGGWTHGDIKAANIMWSAHHESLRWGSHYRRRAVSFIAFAVFTRPLQAD